MFSILTSKQIFLEESNLVKECLQNPHNNVDDLSRNIDCGVLLKYVSSFGTGQTPIPSFVLAQVSIPKSQSFKILANAQG